MCTWMNVLLDRKYIRLFQPKFSANLSQNCKLCNTNHCITNVYILLCHCFYFIINKQHVRSIKLKIMQISNCLTCTQTATLPVLANQPLEHELACGAMPMPTCKCVIVGCASIYRHLGAIVFCVFIGARAAKQQQNGCTVPVVPYSRIRETPSKAF